MTENYNDAYRAVPPPSRGRGPLFWILIAGIFLVVCGCGAGALALFAADDPERESLRIGETPPAEVAEGVALTNTGRDGKFEFTVTGFECGDTEVGEDPFTLEAVGVYCTASLKVENIGAETRSFDSDAQKLIDVEGRSYEPVFGPDIWVYEDINPGISQEFEIHFDVPEGTEFEKMKLHDAAFSGGVEVALP